MCCAWKQNGTQLNLTCSDNNTPGVLLFCLFSNAYKSSWSYELNLQPASFCTKQHWMCVLLNLYTYAALNIEVKTLDSDGRSGD